MPLIEAGTIILTPNKRLAVKIHQAYGALMSEKGLRVWEPPAVWSGDQWLAELWSEAQDTGVEWANMAIVSSIQRRQLLHQVVKGDADGDTMGVTQLAAHVDSAYRSLELWQLHPSSVPAENIGSQKFQDWAQTFSQQLAARGMVRVSKSRLVIWI